VTFLEFLDKHFTGCAIVLLIVVWWCTETLAKRRS
jgi:hypothetical protein